MMRHAKTLIRGRTGDVLAAATAAESAGSFPAAWRGFSGQDFHIRQTGSVQQPIERPRRAAPCPCVRDALAAAKDFLIDIRSKDAAVAAGRRASYGDDAVSMATCFQHLQRRQRRR